MKIRIYYEDTDAGGVVYYANYLKFAERARTEFLRQKGYSQEQLKNENNLLFVVRKSDIEIFKPAFLDDLLTIKTEVKKESAVKYNFIQTIYKDDILLAKLESLIISVNKDLKPIKCPIVL